MFDAFDHSSDPMHEFILDIVQCDLLLLSTFDEAHVVLCHSGIEVDGSQGRLCQQCLNLTVGHVIAHVDLNAR